MIMKINEGKNQAGYSLVELMVVILLTAMLTIGVIGMFVSMVKSQSKSRALAGIKEEGDYITTRMERAIRDGKVANCTVANVVTIDKIDSSQSEIDLSSVGEIKIDGVTVNNAAEYGATPLIVSCPGVNNDRVLIQFSLTSDAAKVEVPFSVYVYLRNSDN